jgi:uncharacterized protein YndB with AHSA1/START domain
MTAPDDVETVERVISAPPEKIFDLLADPARHHDIDGSGTVHDVKDGTQRLALDSTFTISMKQGIISYSVVNKVVEFEENRRIAWQPRARGKILSKLGGGRIWRYELEPIDGGTRVRESWDITQETGKALMRRARHRTRRSMEQTLERIEGLVAS